jgi:mevalonate kinase
VEPLATGRACGKLILLGEHFVVHGEPALALPLTAVATTVVVHEAERGERPSLATDLPGVAALARRLLEEAVARLGLERRRWSVAVDSGVPLGAGLGSSAAFAVALVRALAAAADQRLTPEQEREHAHALERVAHGSPSGVDDAVVTFARPVWFRRGQALRFPSAPAELLLVLASDGARRSTRDVVERVQTARDSASFSRLCSEAGEVAQQGLGAFEAADSARLGAALDRNHVLLQALGVSTPALDGLVQAARRAGALGAKLTGAGGGGFIVALVEPATQPDVVAALQGAGAAKILRQSTGARP